MKSLKLLLLLLIATTISKAQEAKTINPFESVIIEMVCDCNPNKVLSTFVTNANGGVNITVPKNANYSFKLVMPPVLKKNNIKMADLANDVAVNFKGNKNVENLSFNSKGVASAKNLQQGNYEMALNRKPPKGPKEPSGPPRGKCPPGETPWLGGCIPIVVVSGLNKVNCPIGTVSTQFGCIDVKNPGNDPEPPRPDGFPDTKNAVDINCPSGKYDANGNCIFGPTNATDNGGNTAARFVFPKPGPFGIFDIDAGFLGSANVKNMEDSKPLFAGNGLSVGLSYRYGSRLGITGRVGYIGGSRNESNLKEFASTLTKAPWVYKTTGFTKTWSQVNFAAGPSIFLGKKYKGEISVIGGVSMGSESHIKIDLYDVNTFYKNVYDVSEKKVKPYWELGGSYRVVTGKKMTLGLRASYGVNGGTFGVNITSFCVPCCCQKHDPNCCANMPKSSKIIGN
jgi:hypothetical protein